MPFCPECKYEYNSNISLCPDCNETLVSKLPDENNNQDIEEMVKDWIPLARFTSDQISAMVLDSMHKKDIPAVILSGTGHFGSTGQMGISSFRPVGGSYTLMIPKEHIVVADLEGRGIMGEHWETSLLVDLKEIDNPDN